MKKLYITLFGALMAFTASARELSFFIGETSIENASTITFNKVTVEDFGSIKEVAMEPELYLVSDIFTADLQVTATCTSGQEIQLCAGGNCERGTTVVKKGVKVSTNQRLPLMFDYVATLTGDEQVPTVTTIIEAVDVKHTETLKSFTIVMGPEQGSVSVIENNADFTFTPAGLVYTLDTPTAFALYSITGKQVMSATLEGSGVLATDKLAKGVYIYTAGAKSGKIYVK